VDQRPGPPRADRRQLRAAASDPRSARPDPLRRKLSQAQAAERNRLIKLLESANIKLSGLISDIFGVSGQAMLLVLIEGKETPAEMAQHARKRMRRARRLGAGAERHDR
jgi:hypothetical protein